MRKEARRKHPVSEGFRLRSGYWPQVGAGPEKIVGFGHHYPRRLFIESQMGFQGRGDFDGAERISRGRVRDWHNGDNLAPFHDLPGRNDGAGPVLHAFQSLMMSSRPECSGETLLPAMALSVSSSRSSTGRATRPFMTISKNAAETRTECSRPFLVMATGSCCAAS